MIDYHKNTAKLESKVSQEEAITNRGETSKKYSIIQLANFKKQILQPYPKRGPTMTIERPNQVNIEKSNSIISDATKNISKLQEEISIAEENNMSKEKPYRHVREFKLVTSQQSRNLMAQAGMGKMCATTTNSRHTYNTKYNIKEMLGMRMREAAENGELTVIKDLLEMYSFH